MLEVSEKGESNDYKGRKSQANESPPPFLGPTLTVEFPQSNNFIVIGLA